VRSVSRRVLAVPLVQVALVQVAGDWLAQAAVLRERGQVAPLAAYCARGSDR
jgi:hypothetical protein